MISLEMGWLSVKSGVLPGLRKVNAPQSVICTPFSSTTPWLLIWFFTFLFHSTLCIQQLIVEWPPS